eukprot:SAG31_NODE_29247_length_398_cov_1.204013_1_plen_43_part_10
MHGCIVARGRRLAREFAIAAIATRVSNTTGYTGCGTLFACLLY